MKLAGEALTIDRKTGVLHVRMSQGLMKRAKLLSLAKGVSVSTITREALNQVFVEHATAVLSEVAGRRAEHAAAIKAALGPIDDYIEKGGQLR